MPTLASVIVLKIQAFSGRPVTDQTRLKSQLEKLLAPVIQPLPAAGRIVLDMTDGMAVVMLGNPNDALQLAEQSQVAAAALPLCIGVNHGPVALAADALRGSGVTGDGLAAGMILAGAAQPGRFLVSRPFHDSLRAVSPNRARDLAAAGVLTDRNVRTHELFALDPAAAAVRRRWMIGAATLSVMGILGLGFAAREVVQLLLIVPPAVIKFDIKPAGAIYVDGVMKGTTPPLQSLEIKPGPHSIEIRNTTFPPLRVDIDLASAEETTITHTFEKPRAPARAPAKAARKPESTDKSVGDHFRDLRRKLGF